MQAKWWLTCSLLLVWAQTVAGEGCLTKLGRHCGYGVGPGYHARCGMGNAYVMNQPGGYATYGDAMSWSTMAPQGEILPNQPPQSSPMQAPPMQAPRQTTPTNQQWIAPPPDVSARAAMPMRQVSVSPYAWPNRPAPGPSLPPGNPLFVPAVQYVPQAQALPQYLIVPQAAKAVTYQPVYQPGTAGW